MTLTHFQKLALGVAGVTAMSIGTFILLAPHAFYASYGIPLGEDPSRLSEIRALGAGLAVLGGIMLAGLARAAWAPFALVSALTVYLAFPIGRIASLVFDGMPSGSILGALAIEIAIAALCVTAFFRRPVSAAARGSLAG